MKEWQRIREAMDACRPDSQDLNDPELRDVADVLQNDKEARKTFERSQRLDTKLRRTIREVDVPAGLEQRLLTQLARAASPEPAVETPLVSAITEVVSPTADAIQPAASIENLRIAPTRRRNWIGLVAAICLVGILATLGVLTRPSPMTLQQLSELATNWTDQALQDGDSSWKPVSADEQISPLLRRAHRWKPLETELDPNAMILDLSRRGGKRLFVFQFKSNRQVVSLPSIPYKGLPTSGRWHMGAWTEQEGVIYIAVTNDRTLLDSLKSTFRPA